MQNRIAYFSSMQPLTNGLSNLSQELLKSLAQELSIDTFASASEQTRLPGWPVYPIDTYPINARRTPYDLNMYELHDQFESCDKIFDLALREPGLVIMNDLTLYDFYLEGAGARAQLLADEVKYAHGDRGLDEWIRDQERHRPIDPLKVNLLRRITERSRGIITHSAWGRSRLQEIAPDKAIYHIPFGIDADSARNIDRSAVRTVLGLSEQAFIAGIFGMLGPKKRVVQVIESFKEVVKSHPTAQLVIVGLCPDAYYTEEMHSAIRQLQLEKNVVLHSPVSPADGGSYIQACDVVIDLDWPTAGRSSMTMARAIGHGKPIIASDVPQVRELNEKFCWRISHEASNEEAVLVETLLHAATHPDVIESARQAAEEYIRDTGNWNHMVRTYLEVITQIAGQDSVSRVSDDSDVAGHETTTTIDNLNPLRSVTGVNCIGDIAAGVGLGTEAYQMMQAILRERIPLTFVESKTDSPQRDDKALDLVKGLPSKPDYPTNLLFRNINDMHNMSDADLEELTGGKYLIARWFWELSQFSDEWIRRFRRVDEVWVASKYTQAAMQAITTKPITIIPAMVEVPLSENITRAKFGLPDDRFIFMFTFAATSTAARKNPFGVIEAFERAFRHPKGKGSPLLVIKAHHLEMDLEEFRVLHKHLLTALQRIGGILITKHFSRQETNDLLACADCYVSLHRAEGFGLGPAEAMYLGKPVIATNYSGNVDFMNDSNSYLVNYKMRQIVAEDHIYNPYGHVVYGVGFSWADPDVDDAARLMRNVYEHPEERNKRGANAASDIRAQLSREAIGHLIRQRIAEIERDNLTSTREVQSAGSTSLAIPPLMAASLGRHMNFIGSLEWSRTRDKAMPFGKVKGIGTGLRILGRLLVQGRVNERQQWINSEAYQELWNLTHEVTAAKVQSETEITALRSQLSSTVSNQDTFLGYMLQYGTLLHAVKEQTPALNQYKLVSVSEEVDGHTRILSSPPSAGSAHPFGKSNAWQVSAGDRTGDSMMWFHVAMKSTQDDRAAFFRQAYQRLSDQDVIVLISNAALTTPLDVGMLQVLYDGPIGNALRATVVRRPRFERRTLTSGYDLFYSADDSGPIATALRTTGTWNPAETDWVRRNLKAGSVVVDIGAHVGHFSILAARLVGRTGKVIAVEPDPINADILDLNKELLPHPENLDIVQAAVGEVELTGRIYRSLTDHGDHQLRLAHSARESWSSSEWRGIGIGVPLRRMDDILSEVGHVDVVKVSSNGFDVAGLRSMESVLRRDRPLILIDSWPSAAVNPRHDRSELREFLTGLGYRLKLLQREDSGPMRTGEIAEPHNHISVTDKNEIVNGTRVVAVEVGADQGSNLSKSWVAHSNELVKHDGDMTHETRRVSDQSANGIMSQMPQDQELVERFSDPEARGKSGYSTDFLGIRTDVTFFPDERARSGEVVRGLPTPSNTLHAQAIEYIAIMEALSNSHSHELSVVELGAGWGPWTCAAAIIARKLNKRAHLIAAEMLADKVDQIFQHLRENGVYTDDDQTLEVWHEGRDCRVKVVRAAISASDGVAYIPRVEGSLDHGARPSSASAEVDYRGVPIQTDPLKAVSLANLIADVPLIDFMHIDVQGYERQILPAALPLLNEHVAALFIGTHSRSIEGELFELMYGAGWQLLREEPCAFNVEGSSALPLEARTQMDGAQFWRNPNLRRHLEYLFEV